MYVVYCRHIDGQLQRAYSKIHKTQQTSNAYSMKLEWQEAGKCSKVHDQQATQTIFEYRPTRSCRASNHFMSVSMKATRALYVEQ